MEIGIIFFCLGLIVFSWYKSGEVKPQSSMPMPHGADNIRVQRVVEIFADGITADLEIDGPEFLRTGIRIKMNGAKIPAGKNAPEKWLLEEIKKQLSGILQSAKDIRITSIGRGNDGVLNSDIIIDGIKLSAPSYDPPPEESRMSRSSMPPQVPPTIHNEKTNCPGYEPRPQPAMQGHWQDRQRRFEGRY